MHIAEGVLSPAVLGGGAVLALAGTAQGLRRLEYDRLVAVGILSAAFFVASLIHVPVGLASARRTAPFFDRYISFFPETLNCLEP